VDAGVADPARIAVGGHSYGAFMAANLLAHAGHLFAAGVARSGAYNRCGRPPNGSRMAADAQDVVCCVVGPPATGNTECCVVTLSLVTCSKALKC
jgi:poly(3-hydroxybutyrate) depolymerase